MPDDKNLTISSPEKGKMPEDKVEQIKISENSRENYNIPEIKKSQDNKLPQIEKEGARNLEKNEESTGVAASSIPNRQKYQQRQKQIESILESGLKGIYLSMAPNKQNEFKIAGEQTAGKINELLERGKAKLGKIIDLIKKWLQVIPGVNKFFLEQEAKIKSDKIIRLKDDSNNE